MISYLNACVLAMRTSLSFPAHDNKKVKLMKKATKPGLL